MSLQALQIRNFRNIEQADLVFGSHVNVVVGQNASGKTSLLEAVYVLGRARSFRAAQVREVIQIGSEKAWLFARMKEKGQNVGIAIRRDRKATEIKVGGQHLRSVAMLLETMPMQAIHSGSHAMLEGGPRFRRQFLDWGVFHVKPSFYPVWKRYRRALDQRNALLRNGQVNLRVWDREVAEAGLLLTEMRKQYLSNAYPLIVDFINRLLGNREVTAEYRSGWPEDASLLETLVNSVERDTRLGYTSRGPHRADLELCTESRPVLQALSRGQQKLLVIALHLGQVAALRELTGRSCIVLVDDLPAELDQMHRERLMNLLEQLGVQVLVTAIDLARFGVKPTGDMRVFHVEHGSIRSG